METEYEKFQRLFHEAAERETLVRGMAETLKFEAGWDGWQAIRGAQLMAPAADRLLEAVQVVSNRYPARRNEACTCSICSGDAGSALVLGAGMSLGAVLGLLLAKMFNEDVP